MAYPENTVNSTGIKYIWDKITALLGGKVDKITGKGLSTNDYTTEEKSKLAGIESGAQVNPTIDSALSGSSTNAVQNKVVKSALDGKADKSEVEEADTPDTTPFLYRQTPYEADRVFLDELVGGSVAWNQLSDLHYGWQSNGGSQSYDNGILTFTPNSVDDNRGIYKSGFITGRKYLLYAKVKPSANVMFVFGEDRHRKEKNFTGNQWNVISEIIEIISTSAISMYGHLQSSGWTSAGTIQYSEVMVIDLTQMFGTTIADYVYTLEQTTAGSGIAWLKSHGFFTKDYYPYNTGELISVKTSGKKYVGFNQWDEEWENGYFDASGNIVYSNAQIYSKNYIRVLSGNYYIKTAGNYRLCYYDENKNFINRSDLMNPGVTAIPNGVSYIRFHADVVGGTYNHNICINISKTEGTPKNGDYVPYEERTYDISNIDLRGIPKLVNNELVYDGDTYESNGDVTRKYGVVDLGSLSWIRTTGYTNPFFFASISDKKDGSCSAISTLARSIDASASEFGSDAPDKTFGFGTNAGNEKVIFVRYDSYTDATTFKTAMSGVYLIYELATPTTETTDPYTNPQICDKDGTEEFIDDRTVPVPVGHNSTYADLPPIMDGDFMHFMADNFASEEYVDRAVAQKYWGNEILFDASGTLEDFEFPEKFNFMLFIYTSGSGSGTALMPYDLLCDEFYSSPNFTIMCCDGDGIKWINLEYSYSDKTLQYTSNATSTFSVLNFYYF